MILYSATGLAQSSAKPKRVKPKPRLKQDHLRELYSDMSLTLRQISERVGYKTPYIARNIAKRLGLPTRPYGK